MVARLLELLLLITIDKACAPHWCRRWCTQALMHWKFFSTLYIDYEYASSGGLIS